MVDPADKAVDCGEIEGIGVNRNSSEVELSNFMNEHCTTMDIRGSHFHKPPDYYADNSSVNDIKRYFARPRLFDRIAYDQTVPGLLNEFVLGNQEIKNRLPDAFNRLEGAYGWRGTIVFRFQVVAQPFQAGRLRFVYEPFYKPGNRYDRSESITAISQLPGVEIDITETTEAILKIPFIHPRSFFSVRGHASIQTLGRVLMYAYTGYTVAPGGPQPTISSWTYIEDLEVIGAAPKLYLQSGKFLANNTKESKAIPGNLSNVLMAGSNITKWAMPRIPLLSAFTGQTAWMLREAAKIAASYGWAKPMTTTAVSRIQDTQNAYQFNCDGADVAYNLGASADNEVAVLPGFAGSDIDETSIAYLASIFSALSASSMNTAQSPGTVLFRANVCPGAMLRTSNTSVTVPTIPLGSGVWPTTVGYLANMFTMWRGSLRFRLKFAKTKFHTGRVVLGFIPVDPTEGTPDPPYVPGEYNSLQYKSVILDLREQNTIDFECPFLSPLPYVDRNRSIGSFFVQVLESLSGPDTVSSVIPFIVEVSGGPDLEFAIPSYGPFGLARTTITPVLQSGDFESFTVPRDDNMASRCIGEKINSVKQLMSRACVFRHLASGTETIYNHGPFVPYDFEGITISRQTYYDYFGAAYALFRGGIVVHNIPYGSNVTVSSRYLSNNDEDSDVNNVLITENRTGVHTKLPYYCPTARTSSPATAVTDFDRPRGAVVCANSNTDTNSNGSLISIRAADDYQVGYFIGCPLLERWNHATNSAGNENGVILNVLNTGT